MRIARQCQLACAGGVRSNLSDDHATDQAGPGGSRDRAAFWAGIVIVAAFEAMLMARFAPPDWNPTYLVASSDADAGQDSN